MSGKVLYPAFGFVKVRGVRVSWPNTDVSPNDQQVAEYAIYAMLSSNAYHNKGKQWFDLRCLGWDKLGSDFKTPDSSNSSTFVDNNIGFAFDIYNNTFLKKKIIAFRGSDERLDYLTGNLAVPPFNLQYVAAKEKVREFCKLLSNPGEELVLTGHSLGGGLALSVSADNEHGLPAIVFDPSPRIFDGKDNIHHQANRIIIYEQHEILEYVRWLWFKDNQIVLPSDVFCCRYTFNGNKHRSDFLAGGLLKQGSRYDLKLVKIAAGMDDFLRQIQI